MSANLIYCLIFYAALVGALTIAEFKEAPVAQRGLKPAAALGFVLIALMVGALDTAYGQIILLGLIACAAGDVLLLSRTSENLFMAGMAAFALGHIAYMTAFISVQMGGLTGGRIVTVMLVILVGIGIFSWLRPHISHTMRIAVPIYVLIILAMVIFALGLPLLRPFVFAMLGALFFAVSDIFVARDRFVSPTPLNALAITPLYFGAQALIALSTVGF